MMRNTTLNLPDSLVQHAKSYAAQHGTTLTAFLRDNLEQVTGYQAESPRADDPLAAFSEGRMAACGRPGRVWDRAPCFYAHRTSGGRLISIASTLPPVLSPNRVPRSWIRLNST